MVVFILIHVLIVLAAIYYVVVPGKIWTFYDRVMDRLILFLVVAIMIVAVVGNATWAILETTWLTY